MSPAWASCLPCSETSLIVTRTHVQTLQGTLLCFVFITHARKNDKNSVSSISQDDVNKTLDFSARVLGDF